jgi:enoyl-CoA hydratase/carnithine racemase
MMSFETLSFELTGNVAVVTFTRPRALNSISEQVMSDLESVLDRVEGASDVNALIFTGTGKAFCVGLDLGLLEKAFDDIPYFEAMVRRLAAIIGRVEALPIPTISAVNGYARAGGFELSCGCDFIVIADGAKIGDAHTDAGVVPAQVTLRLKRRVGAQRAKEILWTARWLSAQEAVEIGLALHVFPAASLVEDAITFARTMTDKPAPAIAILKRIMIEGEEMTVAEGTELELEYFGAYMSTQPYGREGYYAFREKRTPNWKR